MQEVALPNGAPNDVDREFVLAYSIQDEVKSFYFPQNLAQLGAGLSNAQQTVLTADSDGAANEQFHSINGAASPPFCGRPVPKRTVGASKAYTQKSASFVIFRGRHPWQAWAARMFVVISALP